MIYKTNEYIYELDVCGEHFLIADRRLWNKCKTMILIDSYDRIAWQMLKEKATVDEIIDALCAKSGLRREIMSEAVNSLIDYLKEAGYITNAIITE